MNSSLVTHLVVIAAAALPAQGRTTEDPPVKLSPFHVQSARINSYPFGLLVRVDKNKKHLTQLLIDTVQPNSEAERLGLKPGDEIIRIDGRLVTEFAADFSPDSEFNRLFLLRPPGAPLKIEVSTRRTMEVTVHATATADAP